MARNQKRTYAAFFKAYGRGPWVCEECGDLIRRHGTRRGDGNIHHRDENVENDDPSNLVMLHTYCHRRDHNVGVVRPEWVRKRIADGHLGVGVGRRHSAESRAKIADSMRRSWADRRQSK